MTDRRDITADEAIALLPDGDEIHTFLDAGFALVGMDHPREQVIERIREARVVTITGPSARSSGHGLAVLDEATEATGPFFIATDRAKLDAFDPPGEP